jgi:hypothetical protein
MSQIDRINGLVGSIAVKAPCKVATTANITLSGEQTIDGVAVTAGDRVLVKDQTTASENGIYDVSATAWSRSPDFNGARDATQETMVRIVSGTVNSSQTYKLDTANPAIGTSSLSFSYANFPPHPSGLTLADGLVALRTIDPIDGAQAITAYRTTIGDEGGGDWYADTSDLSTEVAADTQSGIYVAPNSDLTGASGAWVRRDAHPLPAHFGALGDGSDDTLALTGMDAVLGYIYLNGGVHNITGTLNLSGIFIGRGKIMSNDAFDTISSRESQPTCHIDVTGTMSGSPVSYGSAISKGDQSFTVANSFTKGDVLVLRNNPGVATDRRKELIKVVKADASSFKIAGGVAYDYAASSITFEKVNTKKVYVHDNIEFENIYFEVDLTENFEMSGVLTRSLVYVGQTYNSIMDVVFAPDSTNCRITFAEACKNGMVRCVGGGKNAIDAHGDIKLNTGVHNFNINVVSDGVAAENTTGQDSSNALHIDPAYYGNPSGYDYLPCTNISGKVESRGNDAAVFLGGTSTYGFGCEDVDLIITGTDGSNIQYVNNCKIDATAVQRISANPELAFYGSANIECYSNTIPFLSTSAGVSVDNIKWNASLDGVVRVYGFTTAGTATYPVKWGKTGVINGLAYTDIKVKWTGHTGTGQLRVGLTDGLVSNTADNVTATILDTDIATAAVLDFVATSAGEDQFVIRDSSRTTVNVVAAGFLTLRVFRKIGALGTL